MFVNGFASRSGPLGFTIGFFENNQLCYLEAGHELFELIRQASELVLSGKPEGKICGSNRKFQVTENRKGAPSVMIPLVVGELYVSKNIKPDRRSDITLSFKSAWHRQETAPSSQGESGSYVL